MNRERVERRTAEFRARVLEVAAELFDSQGVEGTKVDDICVEADVARRTLFNHFPTKAHIIRALAADTIAGVIADIDAARLEGDTTADRVAALFERFRRYAGMHGVVHRELLGEFFHVAHGTPDEAENAVRLSDAVTALIAEGHDHELPKGARPEVLAEMILGTAYCITLEWIHRDDYEIDRHLVEAARLFGWMFRD